MEFAGDEHAGDAQQLELVNGDSLLAQVAVDQIYCDVERFRKQFEFNLDYDEPVDQNFSLLLCDVLLPLEVVPVGLKDFFYLGHPDVDLVPVVKVLLLG